MPTQICAYHDDVCTYRPVCTHLLTKFILAVVRDVRERGRDIEGCIKQWFKFVKPNFHRYVERQRDVAGNAKMPKEWNRLTQHLDIIVPRGIENQVAIGMPCSLDV